MGASCGGLPPPAGTYPPSAPPRAWGAPADAAPSLPGATGTLAHLGDVAAWGPSFPTGGGRLGRRAGLEWPGEGLASGQAVLRSDALG